MARKDITNNRYGRLTVIAYVDKYYCKGKQKDSIWLCQCDCGNQATVRKSSLENGCTKSCGCLRKYNQYDLSNKYGIGYTSKGEEFYFDLEDYNKIKDYCWFKREEYICTSINGKLINMHRFLFEDKVNDMIVDHRNHNCCDNRKENLRLATYSQNNMNRTPMLNTSSGIVGVTWYKTTNKWKAQIKVNKKNIHLGYYKNFGDAVKARKEAEERYFGEWSYDNSMKGETA